jgi:iron only hydrogenase large subunit-like protein/uncharacterized Fe-S cluster-containing protein
VICPQNAKEVRRDIETAESFIKNGDEVYASLAPSFTANYADDEGRGCTIDAIKTALGELGFTGAEETAIGATIVKRQYDALVCAAEQKVIISSCCHSINQLIQKYYPEAVSFLAHVLSPMLVHCMDLKKRHPGAKTVFIGPCISKKAEAESYPGFADCVLTFEELSQWLERENIPLGPENSGRVKADAETSACGTGAESQGLARFFPVSGGILRTMKRENENYAYLSVDGMENCMHALEDIVRGKLDNCFIEMSACRGSCTGGPLMNRSLGRHERRCSPVKDYIAVASRAGKNDFLTAQYSPETLVKKIPAARTAKVHFGEAAILDVLKKIGKTKPEDELNCGTCGYNTCREKALAVLGGKANLFMCLPYLVEKAESFSDDIIKNTPNGIIVLNETLEVQQINAAACRLLNITPSHILGDQVVRILDPEPFISAVDEKKNTYNKTTYLADYEKYVDETVIYDNSYRIIICIMRDVTEETRQRTEKEEFNRRTVEITNKVIEKQMTAVQEIASLLGESTAETKIALTKLKESLAGEPKK